MMCRMMVVMMLAFSCRVCLGADADGAPHQWYKGNTHTHTLWSDGNQFPEMVVDGYKQAGYHFLVLSDHDVLSEGEKWVAQSHIDAQVARRTGREDIDALGLYRARFGDVWVQTRDATEVEVRLKTLAEIRPLFDEPGRFLLIQGEEISDMHAGKPVHMGAINLRTAIARQGGDSLRDTIDRIVRAVRDQARDTGRPMLAHLNHPAYQDAVAAPDVAAATGVAFVEMFNGHPITHTLGDADHMGDERRWDIANTIRLGRMHAPPIFGLATDDSHNHYGSHNASPGRGWIVVRAAELSEPALIDAMHRGDFYASTGVTLRDIRYDAEARTVTVEIDPAPGETYTTAFTGARIGNTGDEHTGVVFATVDGVVVRYQLVGDELFVRATIRSDRPPDNPLTEGQVKQAWTQPFGWHAHVRHAGESPLRDPMPLR